MDILYITLLTLISAAIGTMTGFGTSTIMIPVLVLFMPPLEAIFLVSIVHWFGNVWKVALFKSGFNVKLVGLFGLSGFIASYAGAAISLTMDSSILLRLLGLFLAMYSVALIFKSDVKIETGTTSALFGGMASGFFAGLFGVGGAIRSAFLLMYDLPKAVYIATAGAIGLLIDSTRIATYYLGGATMEERLWWGLMLFIPASFVGAYIAKRIVNRIPQATFRAVVACLLLVLGIKMLLFPS